MKLRHGIAGVLLSFAVAAFVVPAVRADSPEDAVTAKSLAAAHAAANGDPLLEALLTELERSRAQLKMDQVAAPYYIEYRVSDVKEFLSEAAFGAQRESQNVHVRLLRVVVRIGDYKYRFTDQPTGWLGATVKVDWPILTNVRLDPFERTGMYNGKDNGSIAYYNWFAFEFWRFVYAQKEIAKAAQTLLEFPPMQRGASFNLEALKAELEKKMEAAKGAASQ